MLNNFNFLRTRMYQTSATLDNQQQQRFVEQHQRFDNQQRNENTQQRFDGTQRRDSADSLDGRGGSPGRRRGSEAGPNNVTPIKSWLKKHLEDTVGPEPLLPPSKPVYIIPQVRGKRWNEFNASSKMVYLFGPNNDFLVPDAIKC